MAYSLKALKQLLQNQRGEVFGFVDLDQYAVLMPLVETEEGPALLFEVRAKTLRRQPGEIGFPGGKIEASDPSPAFAAVRETAEELGIGREQIEVWSKLGILVPPYQIAVHVYIGNIQKEAVYQPNPAEVETTFTVPISHLLLHPPEVYGMRVGLLPEDDFPYEHITGGRAYPFRQRIVPEYFYFYQDYVIWGMTARIVHQFLRLLQEAE
ncbi:MAG: CoA pyrophosphatase [Candidatus Carbobacillus altaicus]|uniref:Putative nudix hydrolase YeaB n=1 Tax=Candidatus Carbonibacillus altaicus TaxID=2163959 RepID=A0A2R6Y4Q2_9BACL|nr:CoA pyrophosphatase [Candidatus Carbobacillus altaicus]PTQ57666.1 MAG: putative nudix hydrolase YeaB [Candidatus Carbobacillus altaicus]